MLTTIVKLLQQASADAQNMLCIVQSITKTMTAAICKVIAYWHLFHCSVLFKIPKPHVCCKATAHWHLVHCSVLSKLPQSMLAAKPQLGDADVGRPSPRPCLLQSGRKSLVFAELFVMHHSCRQFSQTLLQETNADATPKAV